MWIIAILVGVLALMTYYRNVFHLKNNKHGEKTQLYRKLYAALVVVVFILIGTIGLRVIEKKSTLDSMTWSISTLTTVGDAGFYAKTKEGKVFISVFTLTSIITFLWALSVLSGFNKSDE